MRKAPLGVVRVGGAVEVLSMATITSGGNAFEVAVDMATDAIDSGVHPRQCKAGYFGVVELGSQPGIQRRMATLASGREPERLMIGHSVLVLHLVARVAIHGQARELAHGGALMTRVAVHCGMRADQREAVGVLLDFLLGNVPPLNRVALLAIRAKLAPMEVGVAPGASRRGVAEYQALVAPHATDVDVHAAQGVFGSVVIELRHTAEGTP